MKLCLVTTVLIFSGAANAFFAPTAFTGQRFGVSIRSLDRLEASGLSMKLFDWKRRENPDGIVLDEVRVDTLKSAPGSRKRHKRKGRGISAGQGASCGFGMRGQKSRSGPGVRAGFEGGQTPLHRRIPKLVGSPMGPGHTKKQFNLIKLGALNAVEPGSIVNFDSLFAAGIVTKTKHKWHKVVGGDELMTADLTVQAHGFTKSAVEAIEAKGGKCELLSPTTNKVLVMDDDDDDEVTPLSDGAAEDV